MPIALHTKTYTPEAGKAVQSGPIVILHGLFGTGDNWAFLSRALAAKGHTVIAVDLRNHGQSPWADSHTYADMAEDVIALLEGLKADDSAPVTLPVTLMGHSMGGKVAMLTTLMRNDPEDLIGRLVVVDMGLRQNRLDAQEFYADAMAALPLDELTDRKAADLALAHTIGDFGIRQFLLKSLGRDEQQRFAWKFNLAGLRAAFDGIGEAVPLDMGKFEGPTLFIRGGMSNYVKPEDEALAAELFPNSKVVTIGGAGHWVHAEAPEAMLEVLGEFLGE